jgi:hypothetical protein
MRLAYVLTAAMPGLLPQIVLEAAPDKGLILGLRRSHGDLMGETVQKRSRCTGSPARPHRQGGDQVGNRQ